MPEQHDLTQLHVQRKLRPKIEDAIPFLVAKEEQQNALDFVAWLRENKMSIGWGGVHNKWDAKFKGKMICRFKFDRTEFQNKGKWTCYLSLDNIGKYDDIILSENLQNYLWDNLFFVLSPLDWNVRLMRRKSNIFRRTVQNKNAVAPGLRGELGRFAVKLSKIFALEEIIDLIGLPNPKEPNWPP